MSFSHLLLMLILVTTVYPLCFWVKVTEPDRDSYRRINLAVPNILGGTVLVLAWITDMPLAEKMAVTVWKAVLLSVSSYSWKKDYPNPFLMTFPLPFGCYAFIRIWAYAICSGNLISLGNLFN